MSLSSCHFCAQANPADSKFCNRCGEPLDLKPCAQCDAMSHVAVERCWQCGARFAPEPASVEVAEIAAGAVTGATPSRVDRAPVARAPRIEPSFDPFERIPVALSGRMEASSERVAAPFDDAPAPLKPLAEASEPDDDAWVDPRRVQAARHGLRTRRRMRAAHVAFAVAVVCAIAAGGYAAYDAGFPSRAADWARAADRSVGASSAQLLAAVKRDIGAVVAAARSMTTAPARPAEQPAVAGASPPAEPSPPPASTAAEATAPGSVPPLPASASAPLPPAATTTATPTLPPATVARSPASAPGPAASVRQETSRHTPREAPKPSRSATSHPGMSKDALATQRLIERDLAGFLPPGQSPPADSPR